MMTVTLTSDHRVINGAVAAEFVNGLKSILENPACMML
jgi:pyruvate dehydrogenase E2 component (dihydrolipoamide acetyltransferase)